MASNRTASWLCSSCLTNSGSDRVSGPARSKPGSGDIICNWVPGTGSGDTLVNRGSDVGERETPYSIGVEPEGN
jgi:hypothetical protein